MTAYDMRLVTALFLLVMGCGNVAGAALRPRNCVGHADRLSADGVPTARSISNSIPS